uniref:Uncharacterized protein n=1 Tax=uncultured prokaryote TaxID=198431 RepID=A0A0H5Q7B7_9ZZZZ|nr:hypothetical protein [uncultured prokaryote]
MPTIDFDLFYAIATEGGLGGDCVLSDTSALLIMSLLASETPETLFSNADGTPLTQAQLEQALDTIDKASNEVSSVT